MSNLQHSDVMPRPVDPTPLNPYFPETALAWTMRSLRELAGVTVTQVAREFGCSPSHISRIERGQRPSRALVQHYEERFTADGLLLSLYEVAEHAPEQHRQRAGGRHADRQLRHQPGDASRFVNDTIPHGTVMEPGLLFVKTWWIENTGTVHWVDRRLERQGPLTGPGLITSPTRYVDVPDTSPGETAEVQAVLRAPGYDCTSIAYFKMVDSAGNLCFPDAYQLGLDVLVRVAGQRPAEGS